MKKFLFAISLMLALTMTSCKNEEDPLRYKDCVVIYTSEPSLFFPNIKLKLNDSIRKKQRVDYLWIKVPKWESDKLHVSDTIK